MRLSASLVDTLPARWLHLLSALCALLGLSLLTWGALKVRASAAEVRPLTLLALAELPAEEAEVEKASAAGLVHALPETPPPDKEIRAVAEPVCEPAEGPAEKRPAPAPLLPQSTRGIGAVVRWRYAHAEGLALLEAGRPAETLAWLDAHAESLAMDGGWLRAQAKLLRARALLAQGNAPEALELFRAEAARTSAPDSGCDTLLGLALCQAGGRLNASGVPALREILDCPNPVRPCWGYATAAFELARRAESSGKTRTPDLEQARALFQKALLDGGLECTNEAACLERLNALTETLVLDAQSDCMVPQAVFHEVAAGDSFYKLAKQYGVAQGQLARLNGLKLDGILPAGRRLKILPGPVTVRVDRGRLTATLLVDGAFIRRYPVGIGPDEKTPAGAYTLRKKLVNPDWYYGGRRIPFGDPENILGTRWLGFDAEECGGRGAGLGLHGTALPESVPGRESKGCVRMFNADVEELYDFVPQGARVEIEE